MSLVEPIAVTLEVTKVLEKLAIPYVVGGSIASSLHGVPRSTNDLDLLVELPEMLCDALVSELSPSFYIDKDMILDAIRRKASFNIIHLRTMFKVDLFVSDRSPLLLEEMSRKQSFALGEPPWFVQVCSAEDIVIQKLDWFEKGNRISERQWLDLVNVLKVSGKQMDLAYVRKWARPLALIELYEKALLDAGLVESTPNSQ